MVILVKPATHALLKRNKKKIKTGSLQGFNSLYLARSAIFPLDDLLDFNSRKLNKSGLKQIPVWTKRDQWSVFIAIHCVSLAYINDVFTILGTGRRWFCLLYFYDIRNIGSCLLLLEIFVCVVQFRLQRVRTFRKKQEHRYNSSPGFVSIATVAEMVTLTTVVIPPQVLPEMKGWEQQIISETSSTAVQSTTLPLPSVICFNLLLVLLLPYIVELWNKGTWVLEPGLLVDRLHQPGQLYPYVFYQFLCVESKMQMV